MVLRQNPYLIFRQIIFQCKNIVRCLYLLAYSTESESESTETFTFFRAKFLWVFLIIQSVLRCSC